MQFRESIQFEDIRIVIANKEEFHYVFVINHFKDEVIGTHQIPDDYNLKPLKVNICMSTDMGKTTQKF